MGHRAGLRIAWMLLGATLGMGVALLAAGMSAHENSFRWFLYDPLSMGWWPAFAGALAGLSIFAIRSGGKF
ncbi:hypothetical protein [uncultured Maritimibacter sp.]|jgi:hypothetical protein|uniref:hypothetical protein n=1 Tax=uncultured Maritimibacter sp. TaxID=991866 RepID=UPI0026306AFB|nr:hypothetical protein [uncultured Maritimibacter sp.]